MVVLGEDDINWSVLLKLYSLINDKNYYTYTGGRKYAKKIIGDTKNAYTIYSGIPLSQINNIIKTNIEHVVVASIFYGGDSEITREYADTELLYTPVSELYNLYNSIIDINSYRKDYVFNEVDRPFVHFTNEYTMIDPKNLEKETQISDTCRKDEDEREWRCGYKKKKGEYWGLPAKLYTRKDRRKDTSKVGKSQNNICLNERDCYAFEPMDMKKGDISRAYFFVLFFYLIPHYYFDKIMDLYRSQNDVVINETMLIHLERCVNMYVNDRKYNIFFDKRIIRKLIGWYKKDPPVEEEQLYHLNLAKHAGHLNPFIGIYNMDNESIEWLKDLPEVLIGDGIRYFPVNITLDYQLISPDFVSNEQVYLGRKIDEKISRETTEQLGDLQKKLEQYQERIAKQIREIKEHKKNISASEEELDIISSTHRGSLNKWTKLDDRIKELSNKEKGISDNIKALKKPPKRKLSREIREQRRTNLNILEKKRDNIRETKRDLEIEKTEIVEQLEQDKQRSEDIKKQIEELQMDTSREKKLKKLKREKKLIHKEMHSFKKGTKEYINKIRRGSHILENALRRLEKK